jgi:hypothetical protein
MTPMVGAWSSTGSSNSQSPFVLHHLFASLMCSFHQLGRFGVFFFPEKGRIWKKICRSSKRNTCCVIDFLSRDNNTCMTFFFLFFKTLERWKVGLRKKSQKNLQLISSLSLSSRSPTQTHRETNFPRFLPSLAHHQIKSENHNPTSQRTPFLPSLLQCRPSIHYHCQILSDIRVINIVVATSQYPW